MVEVSSGTSHFTWDEEARIGVVRFDGAGDATGTDAVALATAIADLVGASEPFDVLADGGRLRSVDADFRAAAAEFFRGRQRQCHIALYNLGPVLSVMADMFRMATRMPIKVLPDENHARAWLDAMRRGS